MTFNYWEEHTSSGRVWDEGYQSPPLPSHCPTRELVPVETVLYQTGQVVSIRKNDKSSLYPGLSSPRCIISSSGGSGSWGSRHSRGTTQSPDTGPSKVWPIYSAGQQAL